jgi:hypothetical protein
VTLVLLHLSFFFIYSRGVFVVRGSFALRRLSCCICRVNSLCTEESLSFGDFFATLLVLYLSR